MHEFSIASGIMESVVEEAKKHNAKKVTRIVLEIGKLSMISNDQLLFALKILGEGTMAEGASIDIITLPLIVKCPKGHSTEAKTGESLYSTIRKLRCVECGEHAQIIGGRECLIKEIVAE